MTFFRDNSLFLWSNEKCLGQLWGPENVHITAVYIIKDQGKVILGGKNDKFYFYSLKELKLISILEVKDMQKVKSIFTAVGLPEHVIYLADRNGSKCLIFKHLQFKVLSSKKPNSIAEYDRCQNRLEFESGLRSSQSDDCFKRVDNNDWRYGNHAILSHSND